MGICWLEDMYRPFSISKEDIVDLDKAKEIYEQGLEKAKEVKASREALEERLDDLN